MRMGCRIFSPEGGYRANRSFQGGLEGISVPFRGLYSSPSSVGSLGHTWGFRISGIK